MDHQSDVVIVGAGLAGFTAAYCAAKAGLSTVVLDKVVARLAGPAEIAARIREAAAADAGDVAAHDEFGTGYQGGLTFASAMTFAMIAIAHIQDQTDAL